VDAAIVAAVRRVLLEGVSSPQTHSPRSPRPVTIQNHCHEGCHGHPSGSLTGRQSRSSGRRRSWSRWVPWIPRYAHGSIPPCRAGRAPGLLRSSPDTDTLPGSLHSTPGSGQSMPCVPAHNSFPPRPRHQQIRQPSHRAGLPPPAPAARCTPQQPLSLFSSRQRSMSALPCGQELSQGPLVRKADYSSNWKVPNGIR
jgi:hypothetical protein